MRWAERVRRASASATLAVTTKVKALKAAGVDVVTFGAGEPDFPTPAFIVEAMVEAARDGATRYTDVAGLRPLREAAAARYSEVYGTPIAPEDVVATVGGKQGLYDLFQVLVDRGDEVLVFSPHWVSYPAQIRLAGGRPVFVSTDEERGFRVDLGRTRAALTERTVGMVINSPNNPTGAVQDAETMAALAALAEERDLWIISDDIYSYLRYDGRPFASPLRERPDLRDRIFIAHGASKTYAMTGWRVGFVIAPEPVRERVLLIQGQSTSNPTTFAQHGAIAALESDHAFLDEWVTTYAARRERMVELLNGLEGVTCQLPSGAFYALPDVSGLLRRRYRGEEIATSGRLTELLLDQAHVAVVDGTPFGAPGHIRLSYACSSADIERGLARVADFVADTDPA